MLRGTLTEKNVGMRSGFRWRSREVSRIEALSDAVFGFAITLLVVSLEVPRTFGELERVLYGFVPFAISFAMLVWIWYHQYEWFRRYGLQDGATIWLNVILLFVMLFYIYRLKLLFGVLINQFAGNIEIVRDGATHAMAVRTDLGLGERDLVRAVARAHDGLRRRLHRHLEALRPPRAACLSEARVRSATR